MAAVISGLFAAPAILSLWICVVAAFAVVESVEMARLVVRLHLFGLRQGILVYDVSQWARNFTFGMFYAFTLAFAERFGIDAAHPRLAALRHFLLAYGAYVVLLLLLVELGLMIEAWAHGDTMGLRRR